MRKCFSTITLAVLLGALSACGGGGGSNSFTSPGSGNNGSGGNNTSAAAVTATTSSSNIASDGSDSATITAFVRDASNNLLSGVPVTFTASSGGISGSPATTDSSGTATATLITAGDSSLRTITVTAAAGSLQSQVTVQVVATSTSATVQMGNGTGGSFQAGIIGISNPNVSAGGSTSLTVSLVQSGGTLYTGSASIGFNSACIAAGTAEIRQNGTVVTSVTTTSGLATVTYVAKGCSGADIITATSTVGGQNLSATGTVTVAAATAGSITFVSATPTNIALKGTGDSSHPETSTVVFKVLDTTGGPVSGANVAFTLDTTAGGLSLSTSSGTSDVSGLVQTVVRAGTVATSVKVTAVVTGLNISTQSSQLTVTTGIPTANSFSLAVGCFNIEGWNYDGTTTTVTARLGDRFQNPVPDGTAITFTAEGGNVQSQCTTTTNANEGGVCTVNYRSSNPRPSDGRVTLLATAIGEESFVDANSNGQFDPGESFTDLGEPFLDNNESSTNFPVNGYDAGEYFFDFFNTGGSLGVRDGPDGLFNGVLCNGNCGSRTLGIGQTNKVILSGSTPTVTDNSGNAFATFPGGNLATNSARPITFWVRDLHDNVMPGGTTIALSASGAGLSISAPSSFTVPCSAPPAGSKFPGITTFGFTVTSSTTTGTGVITLTVTTPKGLVTTTQINVTVQ